MLCCSTAPMVVVEASVMTASCADGSGLASSVARDKLDLHSLKALWSSGVQAEAKWQPSLSGDFSAVSRAEVVVYSCLALWDDFYFHSRPVGIS
jgi:hypothetical protein